MKLKISLWLVLLLGMNFINFSSFCNQSSFVTTLLDNVSLLNKSHAITSLYLLGGLGASLLATNLAHSVGHAFTTGFLFGESYSIKAHLDIQEPFTSPGYDLIKNNDDTSFNKMIAALAGPLMGSAATIGIALGTIKLISHTSYCLNINSRYTLPFLLLSLIPQITVLIPDKKPSRHKKKDGTFKVRKNDGYIITECLGINKNNLDRFVQSLSFGVKAGIMIPLIALSVYGISYWLSKK